MTKRQKLTITICAILMLIVIAGLSVAIVLVASQASVTSSMKVTFTSYEVSATITCRGYIVDMTTDTTNGVIVEDANHPSIKTPTDGVITFEAGQQEALENVEFNEVTYTNSKYRVRYEFEIANTSTRNMSVECTRSELGASDNNMSTYLRNYTDDTNEAEGVLEFTISGLETKVIYFFVYVTDPASDGYFEGAEDGSLSIVLTGLSE